MRILVIGAGGVGGAVAAIARRRDFFERMVLADLSLDRARAAIARAGDDERFAAVALDASDADAIVALAEVRARRRDPQRLRPVAQPADLRRRRAARVHVPRHGDDAVRAPSGAPVRAAGRDARRRAVRGRRRVGAGGAARAVRDRRRAGAVGRLRALRRRPPVRRGSTRSASATAPTSRSRATRSRRRSRSGRRSRSASTRRSSGSATAAGTRPRRSPSRRCSSSPPGSGRRVRQRGARGGRPDPPLGRLPSASTFKYGLGEEFIGVLRDAATCSGSTRPSRCGSRASRSRRATSSRRRCRTRRRSATS